MGKQAQEELAQGPVQEAAAPRRVKKGAPSVPELVVEMDDWMTAFKRAVAGYNTLNLSYQSFLGKIPDGERKKGLPIFKFTSTIDGRTPIEVVADLKKVDPAYLQHVLVPLINAQGVDMLEALDEVEARVEVLRKHISAMMPQQEAEGEQEEDE